MLPLRSTNGVSRFPWATAVLIGIFIAAEIVLNLLSGTRLEALLRLIQSPVDFDPAGSRHWLSLASSLVFFGNIFSLWITALYVWSFLPALVERSSLLWSAFASIAVTLLTYFIYRNYHGPHAVAPLLLTQVWVSAILGLAMRHEIWDSITTVVFGRFKAGSSPFHAIFEVPSYVLLFFWFFYMMLGNLFLDSPMSDAPTIYFMPLAAFILSFVAESFWVLRLPPGKIVSE